MFVNKAARYGLYAMVLSAREPHRPVTAGEVAKTFRVSENHVAKVLQQLVRGRLVSSVRGVGGGYRLSRPASEITMLDVIECVEGPLTESCKDCELRHGGGETCSPHPAACAIHRVFAELNETAYYTLRSITVATLARSQLVPLVV